MKVINRGVPQELNISTISLVPQGEEVFLFRCYHCGEAIEQYVGRVAKIMPMFEPTEDAPVFRECKCGRRYTFQTHRSYDPSVIRTILQGNTIQHDFMCVRCRANLITYTNTKFVDLINYLLHELPFELTCTTNECNFCYQFTDVVE